MPKFIIYSLVFTIFVEDHFIFKICDILISIWKLNMTMDIKTMDNSTVLLKFCECFYKVKFQYSLKRKRLNKEIYSEQCAKSQICFLLNELFSKVRDGKIVTNVKTEYFYVNVRTQDWLLGSKMQLKSEQQCLHCYPKVFLLVVELKDFLIKKEMVQQPTPVNCNNLKMSQNKKKIFEETIVGYKGKEKVDVSFANNISRESSPHVSKVNTLRTFILATPKQISVDTMRSKSLKKQCNISDILNKHDNVVKSISTPFQVTPRRQCYNLAVNHTPRKQGCKLTVNHFFNDGNNKLSNSEQQVEGSSKHCNEKRSKEKRHLKSEKSFMCKKKSKSHVLKSNPHQHNIIKQYSLYNNPINNQTSQKMGRPKGSQTDDSTNMSGKSNSVSKIHVRERQKLCASSSQNEKNNDYNYLPINKRKRQEATNGWTELNNSHECRSRKKATFKKVFTTGISNTSALCRSVGSTPDSCLLKVNGNEMENIEQILVSVNSISQHCPHTKYIQGHNGLETVNIQNELTNMKLQQNLSYPDKQLGAHRQQFIHHQPKDKICKPESKHVMSHSYNLTDSNVEIYDSVNSCMKIVDQLPGKLYKDDVCLLRSPQVKLVKISRKRTFDS